MSSDTLLNVLIQDLISADEGHQRQATELLRLLTQTNVNHRNYVARSGVAMRALMEIVSQESFGDGDQRTKAEHAIAILFHLLMNEELIYELGLLGLVKPITQNVAREERSIQVRENAAGALLCLATLDCNKAPIGIYGGIAGLLSLLPYCSDHGKKNVLIALLHLLVYDGNKTLAARSGAASLLLDLYNPNSGHVQSQQHASDLALSVLKIMASHPEGASAIAAASGVEKIAATILETSSMPSREKAVITLLRVFNTQPSLAGHLETASHSHHEALFSCLNEISIHGSRKGRRAATSLLKLFMDMEVGDHSRGHHQVKADLAKEQDEQEEEDGEELAEAVAGGHGPSNYGEHCYDKYPVKFSKEAMADAADEEEEEEEEEDDNDDDDDDDAFAVRSSSTNYIEVPIAY